MNESTRYIVFKVTVKHEPGADVQGICKVAQVFADDDGGQIDTSEVVGVFEKKPG